MLVYLGPPWLERVAAADAQLARSLHGLTLHRLTSTPPRGTPTHGKCATAESSVAAAAHGSELRCFQAYALRAEPPNRSPEHSPEHSHCQSESQSEPRRAAGSGGAKGPRESAAVDSGGLSGAVDSGALSGGGL